MKNGRLLLVSLVAALVFACSHTIPPPITVASANAEHDASAAAANPANADSNLTPPFGPFDVQTAFYVSKSNDLDRVDYGMRLDQHCAPLDDQAVFPYWRELQHAPPVRSHPISFLQYLAYGFSAQRVVDRGATGGRYHVQLKQVDRAILIVTGQDASLHCRATAYATIQNVAGARLDHIFAEVTGPFGVKYVDVYGVDPKTGAVLIERMKP